MAGKRVRFARCRRSVGLTQEDLAERLGVERSTVVRWEAGDTTPQPWQRPRLARTLGIEPEELESLLQADNDLKDAKSDRLAFALRHPSRTDSEVIEELRELVSELDSRYDALPSAALIGSAGQVHAQITHLRSHTTTHAKQSALAQVEAQSSIVMAQLVWDVSQRRDHSSAAAYLDQATQAANRAEDAHLAAYSLLRKSYLSLYGEKDPIRGAGLAQVASDMAHAKSPSLSGLAQLHVAEGGAMAQNQGSCEAALGQAEALLQRKNDDDPATAYFTRGEYDRLAGSCYLSLGLMGRAEASLQAAASELRARKKSQAIVLGNLSLALIGQGRADEGVDVLHHALDEVEQTRGGGGLNIAFTAGRTLRRWRHEPWVQDVHDRLFSLMEAT
ncbi:helix-turn-helix domain-containing protein [Nocardiopsis chromatogenes]|uniref:helix-turn-helix domain-containing protein n=1 Tax=Nocardiopsis chromatogenes TaxID=280239 RepID=UPI000347D5D6|nr:helix-turn-helix domain-containing protein [Nocardiopsis chromatogenes]